MIYNFFPVNYTYAFDRS